MFDHIFENRDKKITKLLKLSDYLGRSLRENIELFSINDFEKKVTFLSESNKIITGRYDLDAKIQLTDIQIEDDDLFTDGEKFDSFIDSKISNFVKNIYEDDFSNADSSFNKVLELWEDRIKFNETKTKLYEKTKSFDGSLKILETEEYQKLAEITPQLIEYLKENRDAIESISEIKNSVRLSEAVSLAFDLPRLDYGELQKLNIYTVNENSDKSIYEMVCKQELVRKELVESKNTFDLVWATNSQISKLSSYIYEQDDDAVARALVEAICEVPYLALISKNQLKRTISNNLQLNESISVSQKDIKLHVARLFEMKKPVKNLLTTLLNEKYGVNVQNLRDIPTFKSLLNTQVLIFEALSRLSPNGSVQKDVLGGMSKLLKEKNGVESLDVNDYLQYIFEEATYQPLTDKNIYEEVSLSEAISSIKDVNDLVKVILESLQNEDSLLDPIASDDNSIQAPEGAEDSGREEAEEVEFDQVAGMENSSNEYSEPTDIEDEEAVEEGDDDHVNEAEESGAAVVEPEQEEKEEEAEGEEKEAPEEAPEKEAKMSRKISPEDLMAALTNFEKVLGDLDLEGTEEEETEGE